MYDEYIDLNKKVIELEKIIDEKNEYIEHLETTIKHQNEYISIIEKLP